MKNTTFLTTLVVFLLCTHLQAAVSVVTSQSAVRQPDQDYRLFTKNLPVLNENQKAFQLYIEDADNRIENPAEAVIPNYYSTDTLQNDFEIVRDDRHVRWQKSPEFLRRGSFLYPQDGCWMRAAYMNRVLVKKGRLPLPKLFVFGNLQFSSPYVPRGQGAWYYHVAPVARIGEKLFVLDPSVDSNRPIEIDTWLNRMGVNRDNSELRICSPQTYDVYESCKLPMGLEKQKFERDLQEFLNREWQNLDELGLPVKELLGNSPPWK